MARQKSLPGTDSDLKPIEAIEEAAENYRKSVTKLVTARTKVGEHKAALLSRMGEHDKKSYKAQNGITYAITPGKEKITMSDKEKYPDADEDGEEG